MLFQRLKNIVNKRKKYKMVNQRKIQKLLFIIKFKMKNITSFYKPPMKGNSI